jgi:hypothetical protein
MLIAAIIIGVLTLLAFLRIGGVAEYGTPDNAETDETTAQAGFVVDAFLGPIRFRLFPATKKKEKKKPKRKDVQKKKAGEGIVKAGRFVELKKQLPAINTLLARLKRKLLIKELTVYFMAAGEDPAAAALWFGGANIGYGLLVPLLENNFRVKKRDLRTSVSFEHSEPYIYVCARLSLAVWEAVYVAFALVKSMLRSSKTTSKIRKAV